MALRDAKVWNRVAKWFLVFRINSSALVLESIEPCLICVEKRYVRRPETMDARASAGPLSTGSWKHGVTSPNGQEREKAGLVTWCFLGAFCIVKEVEGPREH